MVLRQFAIAFEPSVFAALERGISRAAQLSVLAPAHLVHRIIEVFGDVKAVMHDIGQWQDISCGTHERWPHIHRYSPHAALLLSAQRTEQATGGLQAASGYDIKHAPAVNVGQDAGGTVATFCTLFIQAQIVDGFRFPSQQAAINGFEHDGIDAAPRQACQRADALGVGASIAIRPRRGQLLHAAVGIFELGHARCDESLKLAGVQMPPRAFVPAVDVGSGVRAGGVCPNLIRFERHAHGDALRLHVHIHRLHRPRRLYAQQMLVKRCVFHARPSRLAQTRILFHCGKLDMRASV